MKMKFRHELKDDKRTEPRISQKHHKRNMSFILKTCTEFIINNKMDASKETQNLKRRTIIFPS